MIKYFFSTNVPMDYQMNILTNNVKNYMLCLIPLIENHVYLLICEYSLLSESNVCLIACIG